MRKKEIKSDIETLKEWVQWQKGRENTWDYDGEVLKAIENVISQVGTWKAKYEKEKEKNGA